MDEQKGKTPMLAIIVKFLIGNIVVALMLSIGLAARPREFAQIVRRPQLYLRALLVFELGVPLLAMAVVSGLGLPPVAAGLILLMAICPGAPFIPLVAKSRGQRFSQVGLNLLVLTSVLAPLTIPTWVEILNRLYPYQFEITGVQILSLVLKLVIVPLALGLAIRYAWPRVADLAARFVHYFFLVALVAVLIVALYLGAPVLLEVPPITLLAVALVVAGSALMGLWAAGPQPEARRATAVAVVLGNPGLALAIIAASYPGFRAAAFLVAYVIVRRLALLPVELWIKRRKTPSAQPPSLVEPHAVGAS